MSFTKEFTWGGATAANQYEGGYDEGGKGLNAVDVLTNGSATEPRKVTWKKPNGETGATPLVWAKNSNCLKVQFLLFLMVTIIQVTKALIFTTITRKILNIWQTWALMFSVFQ